MRVKLIEVVMVRGKLQYDEAERYYKVEARIVTRNLWLKNDNHASPRSARNAPISLPLPLPPPIPGLGNLRESPLSIGNPSNSSRGVKIDSELCGRTMVGSTGKVVPTGDGNEGDCEVEDDLFEECDVDDCDLDLEDFVWRRGSVGAGNESERAERGKGTICGEGWEFIWWWLYRADWSWFDCEAELRERESEPLEFPDVVRRA